ncbi:MAG: hypothetical protein ACP5UA_08110 [Candidatus Hydrogenedens sp.]
MVRNFIFIFSTCVIISFSIFADGVLTISDVETATPGVFQLSLNWNGNNSNISTLIIQWNCNISNIFPLEVEPSSTLGAEKKLMYSVTGSQINIIIYGGTQPIPNGLLGNLVAQSTTRLADNLEIQITGVSAEGADNKALTQNVSVNAGKITVKNNNDYHSADTNKDWSISLSEVLRVVQLYNAREYHCESGTEDGYAPFEGNKNCSSHKSDYNPQDWKIRLNELLRIIQFFNFPGGSYHLDVNGEDNYNPGPFSK